MILRQFVYTDKGFIVLPLILHAVKCQAPSSPKNAATNPIAGYTRYSITQCNIGK